MTARSAAGRRPHRLLRGTVPRGQTASTGRGDARRPEGPACRAALCAGGVTAGRRAASGDERLPQQQPVHIPERGSEHRASPPADPATRAGASRLSFGLQPCPRSPPDRPGFGRPVMFYSTGRPPRTAGGSDREDCCGLPRLPGKPARRRKTEGDSDR